MGKFRFGLLVAVGLLFTGCRCVSQPEYRCSDVGIVEYRENPLTPWNFKPWEPLRGEMISCTPGKPITADSIVRPVAPVQRAQ